MGIALVFSVSICILFKVDILSRLIPDLPGVFSGYVSYALSGLGISLSTNVIYKLAIKSPQEARLEAEVINEAYQVEDVPVAKPIEIPIEPELPAVEPELPAEEKKSMYRTKLLTVWKTGEAPKYVLIEKDSGKKSVIELSE